MYRLQTELLGTKDELNSAYESDLLYKEKEELLAEYERRQAKIAELEEKENCQER